MGYNIGIDLGVENIKAGLVDEAGNILCKESIHTRSGRMANEIVRDIAYLTQNVVASSKMAWTDIDGAGISFSGMADNSSGFLIKTNGLPLNNTNIRQALRRILPLPIYVETDANCKAITEFICGAAAGSSDSITVIPEKTVGIGIIINQRLFNGFNSSTERSSHFVIDMHGRPCECGRDGCFNAYASEHAFIKEANKEIKEHPESILSVIMKDNPDSIGYKTVFEAALKGDTTAMSIANSYIETLSTGLMNLANLFCPETIVLAGSIVYAGDALLESVRRKMAKWETQIKKKRTTSVQFALRNENAGIIGGAMAAKISRLDGIAGE